MFSELSKRLKLPLMQTRFMFPEEICRSLGQGRAAKALKRELKVRTKFAVYYAEKGLDKMFYGGKARQLENKIVHRPAENITELQGQTACLGKAKGKVRIINSPSDMKKMARGDILVSIATNPDIVPAMKKAAAIVTEQGGITSHAAIVSRELGIPCVIGTKIATKIFKDGDIVEVDANKGIVKKLSK